MTTQDTSTAHYAKLSRGVCLILAVGVAARVAMLFLSREALAVYRLPDDALYYFAIARHIIAGHGISFNGVSPTNGFHPLWLVALLPVFALKLSNWSSIYAVLAFQSAIDIGIMFLIARFLQQLVSKTESDVRNWAIAIGVASYALNPSIIVRGINGLETSVAALVLILWLMSYSRAFSGGFSTRSAIGFGVLSGLLFLARTDFSFILVVAGICLVLKRFRELSLEWKQLFIALVCAIIIVLPWLIWNQVMFGSIVQVSGLAVPFMAQRKYDLLYSHSGKLLFLIREAARNILKPFVYCGAGLSLLAILLPFAWKRRRSAAMDTLMDSALLPPLLGALLLLAFHSIARGFIRDWYILQLLPMIALLFGISAASLSIKTGRVILVLLICVQMASVYYEWKTPRYESQTTVVFAGVPFIEKLPTGTRVGSLNSGWYGFFAPKGVLVENLDGVVNPAIYPSIVSGDMHGYIDRDSISYLLDFQGDLAGYRSLIDHNLLSGFVLDSMLGTPKATDSLELLRRNPVFTGGNHLRKQSSNPTQPFNTLK